MPEHTTTEPSTPIAKFALMLEAHEAHFLYLAFINVAAGLGRDLSLYLKSGEALRELISMLDVKAPDRENGQFDDLHKKLQRMVTVVPCPGCGNHHAPDEDHVDGKDSTPESTGPG